MKKVLEYLFRFLEDRNRAPSHKRLLAMAGFVVAVIIAFTSRDVAMASLFLGLTGYQSGTTLFEKGKYDK